MSIKPSSLERRFNFHEGRAVFGQCLGARLPVPVYETAFALARLLEERGERDHMRITVVSPDAVESELGDREAAIALEKAFDAHRIEYFKLPHRIIDGKTPQQQEAEKRLITTC